jgi:cell division protein FtsB
MGDVSNENTEKLLKEIDNLSQRVSFLETQVFNLQDINRMLKETFVNYCNFY